LFVNRLWSIGFEVRREFDMQGIYQEATCRDTKWVEAQVAPPRDFTRGVSEISGTLMTTKVRAPLADSSAIPFSMFATVCFRILRAGRACANMDWNEKFYCPYCRRRTYRTYPSLACDLRSRGIDVLVIDKAAGPATTSRALGLQARGREILGRLGALGDLPKRALHARATNVYVGKRRLIRFVVETQLGRINLGALLISQAEVEAELRKRLAELGGRVLWDHEAVAATQDGSGVSVTVRTGERESSAQADWLVGCDGAHSRVRKIMDVQFEGRPFPESLVLADVQIDWDGWHPLIGTAECFWPVMLHTFTVRLAAKG
jgi:hypothetical protein